MRTFSCSCGNMIFFDNSKCLACGEEVGWCPACESMTTLVAVESTGDTPLFRCAHDECGATIAQCHNYAVEDVCNRCVTVPASPALPEEGGLCAYCMFTETIPDLSVEGNRARWYQLEQAKRRLLWALDELGLPYGRAADGFSPPLSFDFKADVVPTRKGRWWWRVGEKQRVYTGHANGKITINLREADAVEREKARVSFNEAHRTVIGHFRHEIGHYYWQVLVAGKSEDECKAVFGDHEDPPYLEALTRYHEEGPPADWRKTFISAYASAHAWEDFAETFSAYLDMVSVLDTAMHMGFSQGVEPTSAELEAMVTRYTRLGVMLNEMNRAMGLLDLVPDVLVGPVVTKLQFVHDLVRAAASSRVAEEEPAST